MANIVDTLVTNYVLNDRYTPALRKIAAETAAATPQLAGLTGGVGSLAAALGSAGPAGAAAAAAIAAVTAALAALTGIVGLATAGVYKLGSAGLKQASEMEILRATLVALRGDTDLAREGFEFLERFATRSVFEFGDLAKAGVQLEAFGLNMERILPIISQIGAAFGAKPEQLMSLAEAFGRISAGQSGEAMQQLMRVGISRAALAREGISITKSGQILSDAEQIFLAIERIATKRFGGINDAMSDTLAVSLSNLQDGWNQFLTQVGDALMPVIKPLLNALKDFMQFMAGGGAKPIIDSMVRAFQAVSNLIGGRDGIISIASYVVAAFSLLPDIVTAVAEAFNEILGRFSKFFGWLVDQVFGLSERLGRFDPYALHKELQRRQKHFAWLFDVATNMPSDSGLSAPGGFIRSENPLQTEYAKQTAENTRVIADEMRLQRFALGGGQLAARGLSPITRGQLPMSGRVALGRASLEQLIIELIDQQSRRRR